MLGITELIGLGSGVKEPAGSVTLLVDSEFVDKSGTFVVPRGITKLRVSLCGGGGGGGSVGFSGCGAGGGGGSGGSLLNQIVNVVPGQSISWTVGRAGNGWWTSAASGLPGGTTTFGALSATGGGGGACCTGAGGAAGSPGGNPGTSATGGSCPGFGTGGGPQNSPATSGNGAGGGTDTACYQNNAGYKGTPGKILVEWGF